MVHDASLEQLFLLTFKVCYLAHLTVNYIAYFIHFIVHVIVLAGLVLFFSILPRGAPGR